ncbi:MAG: hypothetical protein ABIH42_04175 [Planctomycetota bacterium]
MIKLKIFLVLITLIVFAAPTVFAQQADDKNDPRINPPQLSIGNEIYTPKRRVMLGEMRFHPFLSQRAIYDDNVYLTELNTKSDIIMSTILGFRSDMFLLQQPFLFGYRARANTYQNESDANNVEHLVNLTCGMKTGNFSFSLKDNFSKLVNPIELMETKQMNRDVNNASLTSLFETSKLELELKVDMNKEDYKETQFDKLDRDDMIIKFTTRYKLSPKTGFVIRADRGTVAFSEEVLNDYTFIRGYGGILGEITGKTSYLVLLGYVTQTPSKTPNTNAVEAYKGPIANINFNYTLNEKNSVGISFLRSLEYNAISNYQVINKFNFNYNHKLSPRFSTKTRFLFENATPGEVVDPSLTQTGEQPEQAWRIGIGFSAWYEIGDWIYLGFDVENRRKLTYEENASYVNNKAYIHLTLLF